MSPKQKIVRILKITAALGAAALVVYLTYVAMHPSLGGVLATLTRHASAAKDHIQHAAAIVAERVRASSGSSTAIVKAVKNVVSTEHLEQNILWNPASTALTAYKEYFPPGPSTAVMPYLPKSIGAYLPPMSKAAAAFGASTHDSAAALVDKVLASPLGAAAASSYAYLSGALAAAALGTRYAFARRPKTAAARRAELNRRLADAARYNEYSYRAGLSNRNRPNAERLRRNLNARHAAKQHPNPMNRYGAVQAKRNGGNLPARANNTRPNNALTMPGRATRREYHAFLFSPAAGYVPAAPRPRSPPRARNLPGALPRRPQGAAGGLFRDPRIRIAENEHRRNHALYIIANDMERGPTADAMARYGPAHIATRSGYARHARNGEQTGQNTRANSALRLPGGTRHPAVTNTRSPPRQPWSPPRGRNLPGTRQKNAYARNIERGPVQKKLEKQKKVE